MVPEKDAQVDERYGLALHVDDAANRRRRERPAGCHGRIQDLEQIMVGEGITAGWLRVNTRYDELSRRLSTGNGCHERCRTGSPQMNACRSERIPAVHCGFSER